MIGEKMAVTKSIAEIGKATRFGADWPGERCRAKTRRGTECQRPAYKHNGRCRLHGGMSTGARTSEGLKRISDANLKHGRYTKEKLEDMKKRSASNRRVRAELARIEEELLNSGLISKY